ncbi:MAG TPA: cyclic nucleotide-binding domain-containing protein [Dictyobacter sp.]|nr:cyclic nucleotide-binding domain-containing protein [Dictyobacter sp.]
MKEDVLARVDLFSTLDKKELQTLATSCQERSFPAGTTIIQQGDSGVGLYVINSGSVHVTRTVEGKEEDMGSMIAGDVLGEMSLLDDLPRSATATASEDVETLILPIWDFRTFLRDHPDATLKLLSVLSRRLRKAESLRHE